MPPVKVAEKAALIEKKAFSFLQDFKHFALKGNVVDLAVGIIIGAAFGKIVDSLVKEIIMPVVALLIPTKESYLGWKLVFGHKEVPYGLFIGEVINFLILAFALYLFIYKFVGWIKRTRHTELNQLPPLTKEQQLLTEIRDLLRKEKMNRT